MGREDSNSKSLIDKLGVKPGMRVSVLAIEDQGFRRDLANRTEDVAGNRVAKDSFCEGLPDASRAVLRSMKRLTGMTPGRPFQRQTRRAAGHCVVRRSSSSRLVK